MPRIAGVDIPGNKRILIALTYVYGIGRARATRILKQANLPAFKKADSLSDDEIARIREVIDSQFQVEGNLRREVALSIKRLMELGTYRGQRHKKNLPCRGQRTSTNARTRKGPKKTVAGKKKAPTSK